MHHAVVKIAGCAVQILMAWWCMVWAMGFLGHPLAGLHLCIAAMWPRWEGQCVCTFSTHCFVAHHHCWYVLVHEMFAATMSPSQLKRPPPTCLYIHACMLRLPFARLVKCTASPIVCTTPTCFPAPAGSVWQPWPACYAPSHPRHTCGCQWRGPARCVRQTSWTHHQQYQACQRNHPAPSGICHPCSRASSYPSMGYKPGASLCAACTGAAAAAAGRAGWCGGMGACTFGCVRPESLGCGG